MADEKVQELSLEDLESVGGGAQFPPCDKKKKSSVEAASDEEARVAFSDGRGTRVANQIW